MVPFDFDEKDCDKEIHLPSDFLKMAAINENVLRLFTDGRMAIDVSSESVVEAFSFYVPKVGKVIRKNVSDLLILLLSAYFKFLSFIPFFFLFCEHL